MYTTENLPFSSLEFYAKHPFKLYEGKRLADMVESIKENGIIVPIIVRPIKDRKGKYEILSGHNRVNAAKEAGKDEIPAVIRADLTEEAAKLIVTETNLIQRSFADLSHCERATVIETHYLALEENEYRTELLEEVKALAVSNGDSKGKGKVKSLRGLGNDYGLDKSTIARYLRISKLIPELKIMLDEERNGKKMPIRAAVSLSYLHENEQLMVSELLKNTAYSFDMKKAEALRDKSENDGLSDEDIRNLLSDEPKEARGRSVRIKESVYSKYFNDEKSKEDITDIIEQALQMWFESKTENA